MPVYWHACMLGAAQKACGGWSSYLVCLAQRLNAIEELHENMKEEYSAVLDFDIAFFQTVRAAPSAESGNQNPAGILDVALIPHLEVLTSTLLEVQRACWQPV